MINFIHAFDCHKEGATAPSENSAPVAPNEVHDKALVHCIYIAPQI